jgi:hypothetical protein
LLTIQVYFGQTLHTRLESPTHAEMWEILADEYPDWTPPPLLLADPVLCLPASPAHSERTISQVRRVLGRHASRTADQTLFNSVQAAMSVKFVDEHDLILESVHSARRVDFPPIRRGIYLLGIVVDSMLICVCQ